MTSITARPGDDARGRKPPFLLPRHWILWTLAAVAVGASVVGVYAWRQYNTLTSAKFKVVNYTVPTAPHLVAGSGETVYRIDPTASQVSYAVNEKLFGHSAHRAVGTTNGIAGDIALNAAHPAASRVGQIVVNVEQLHSDNNLRDARMRPTYLDSHDYPLANLTVAGLSGMPPSITEGTPYHFTMSSQLTVKKTPAPVSWDVERDARRRQADRHRDDEGEDVDVRHRSDQHRRTREHLGRRDAHDAADRARPVEVHHPDVDRRARVGAASRRTARRSRA